MKYLFLPIVIFLFSSCHNENYWDNKAIKDATTISNTLDSSNISNFKKWSYSSRGDNWTQYINDTAEFNCLYEPTEDSISITIWKLRMVPFEMLYPLSYKIEYNDYDKIILIKNKKNSIKIIGGTVPDYHSYYIHSIPEDSLFKSQNPFKDLEDLNTLKKKLPFFATTFDRTQQYYKFYISLKHILVYFPPECSSRNEIIDANKGDIQETMTIKKNWYLIKLKGEFDAG